MPVVYSRITYGSRGDAHELSTVCGTSGRGACEVPSGSRFGQAMGGTLVNHGVPDHGSIVTAAAYLADCPPHPPKEGSGHERLLGL